MNSRTPLKKKARPANGKGNQSDPKQYFRGLRRKGEVTRHTYHARVDLLEKIRGYAYWERIGISALINQILEEFFEGKEVKPCPSKRSRCQWRTSTKPKQSTH